MEFCACSQLQAIGASLKWGCVQVPVGLPTVGPLSEMVAAACDGMRVPLVLLPELPKLMPAIMAALGDEPTANAHP